MKRPFTIEDIKNSAVAHLNEHLIAEKKVKKAKYGNRKTNLEGKTFDSKKEAKRYRELNLLLKAGVIGMLSRQTEYELNVGGTHSLKYVDDFSYVVMATGEKVVEDVKSDFTRTLPTYKKKKNLMLKIYKIQITEI